MYSRISRVIMPSMAVSLVPTYSMSAFVFFLISLVSSVHSFHVGAWRHLQPSSRRYPAIVARQFQTKLRVVPVREWREEDMPRIIGLLADSFRGFDPEGPLEIDCGSAAAIQESYDPKDGGCFLVAANDDSNIMGTAALFVGTQITYLKSGASISSPVVTGAVRRVCTIADATPRSAQESILQALLEKVESRAVQNGVTELIVLAYPSTRRPNAVLLDKLGYRKVPCNLDGVVQYRKSLGDKESESISRAVTTANSDDASASSFVTGSLFVSMLLVVFGFVGNLMGLELLPSNDNRGIGTPLSIQEVQRLEQDEELKRTNLDDQGAERQWEDLGVEERREEAALLKIIQGQDIRFQ